MLNFASRALAKLSPPHAALPGLMKDPEIKNVPSFAVEPARTAEKDLAEYTSSCKRCITSAGSTPVSFEQADVDTIAKSASDSISLLKKMLAIARTNKTK